MNWHRSRDCRVPSQRWGSAGRVWDRYGAPSGRRLLYQIVDIAVQPEHQGRGLGKQIMSGLMDRLREIAPAEAYVSLVADGDAKHLYAQFGFEEIAPASVAMARWIGQDEL